MVNQNIIDKTIEKIMKNRNPVRLELALKLAEYCDDDNYHRVLNGLYRNNIYTVQELMEVDLDELRHRGLGEHSKNILRKVKGLETKPVKHYNIALSKMTYEELIELENKIKEEIFARDNKVLEQF